VSNSTSVWRPGSPDPADRPKDTTAMTTKPSGQTVSMIACTRVRIA